MVERRDGSLRHNRLRRDSDRRVMAGLLLRQSSQAAELLQQNMLLQRHRLVSFRPKLLLFALEGRRIDALDDPQSSLRLVNMELPVIPFVCDIRFDDLADPGCGRMICFVGVRLSYCDVVNRDPDEGVACVGAATNVDVVATKFDEVDDYIEGRKTSVGVHSRDVLR
jgi:hypothetical protein